MKGPGRPCRLLPALLPALLLLASCHAAPRPSEQPQPHLPYLERGGSGYVVRAIPLRTAHVETIRFLHLIDGDDQTNWANNSIAYRYQTDPSKREVEDDFAWPTEKGLDLRNRSFAINLDFDRTEPVDTVQLRSFFPHAPRRLAAALVAGEREEFRQETADNRSSLVGFTFGGRPTRRVRVTVGPHQPEEPPGACLAEITCLQLRPAVGPPAGLGPAERNREGDSWVFTFPAPDRRSGVQGLAVSLPLEPSGQPLRLAVRDPLDPAVNLMEFSCWLADQPAGRPLNLVLDFPDQILEPGQPLSLAVSGARPRAGQMVTGRLLTAPAAAAQEEFLARQMQYVALYYSHDAEGWRWSDKLRQRLQLVLRLDPGHEIARRYLDRITTNGRLPDGTRVKGEHIIHPDVGHLLEGPPGVPAWAWRMGALLRQHQEQVHWWIDNWQQPDGQLGGGWNDDVELTFRWAYLPLITGDDEIRDSLRLVADGIWDSGRLRQGYSAIAWDVEHACEDTTCTQPLMVVLDYGDPRYVERNMETIANLPHWTFVDDRGFRRFRSCFFQADRVDDTPPKDIDHPYNTYALIPGWAVIWYNRQPLVTRWFSEYGLMWHDAMSRTEAGKPAWAVPREIHSGTGQIGYYSGTWERSEAYYSGGARNLWCFLLGCYQVTGNRTFLEPYERIKAKQGERVSPILRRDTGIDEQAYYREDANIVRQADENPGARDYAFQAWLATGDKSYLERFLELKLVEAFRDQFIFTAAQPPTDRTYLAGAQTMAYLYLGSYGADREHFPNLALSYDGFGADFAALVLDCGPTGLKVLLCNLRREPVTGAVRFWQIDHGRFALRLGPDADGDDQLDEAVREETRELRRGDRVELTLPPRAVQVLELEQLAALDSLFTRPDLALAERDVQVVREGRERLLRVRLHNIGAGAAENVSVVVRVGDRVAASSAIRALPAPEDLQPRCVDLVFPAPEPGAAFSVEADPEDLVPEINEDNNVIRRPAAESPAP